MSARNLENLNQTELEAFLNSFDTVLCDCDGVLWTEPNTAVPGVKETIAKLKKLGKKVHFVTNNSARGIQAMHQRFVGHNYDVKIEEITYPLAAIMDYLKTIDFDKELYVIGSPFAKKDLKEAGFKLFELENDQMEHSLPGIIAGFQDNPNVGAVVVDLDLNLTYLKLLKASVYLRRQEVLYLKGGNEKKVPYKRGVYLIGAGYLHEIVEDLTGREGLSFGKPDLNLCEYLKKKCNIQDPKRVLFVGDALEQDMEFASRSGYQKLLVFTGGSRIQDIQECKQANYIPNFYLNTFGQLHDIINKL